MNADIILKSLNDNRENDLPKLIVVVPSLNEEESIGLVLDEISEALNGLDYSVVVVDGRSMDRTCQIANKRGALVINQHSIGYGDALLTGFLYAREKLAAELIAMMDADMTYDPNDIPSMMKPIMSGEADFVIGNRFMGMEKGAMTAVNSLGNRVLSWFARLFLRISVHDTQCGLRVFRAYLVDRMDLTQEGMPFATEMLAEAKFSGARISEVPVRYRSRIGTPKLSPFKDGLMIFGAILRLMRDTKPLLFFGGLGFLFGIIGFLLGLDVTLGWFKTQSIKRVPTLILSVLLLMGAMQFFTLGLVADMIKGLRKRNNRF